MFDIIRRVGIFMICAQMIVHLKPNESYAKYLKLLMSIMVMVQIIFPVMQLLGSQWDGTIFADRVRAYGLMLQGEKGGTDITNAADQMLEEYARQEIQSRLEQQAREEAAESGAENRAEADAEDQENGDTTLQGENVKEVERIAIDRIEVD